MYKSAKLILPLPPTLTLPAHNPNPNQLVCEVATAPLRDAKEANPQWPDQLQLLLAAGTVRLRARGRGRSEGCRCDTVPGVGGEVVELILTART